MDKDETCDHCDRVQTFVLDVRISNQFQETKFSMEGPYLTTKKFPYDFHSLLSLLSLIYEKLNEKFLIAI